MVTDQHRKMIQSLMSQPQWAGVEAFYQDFMTREFIQGSAKRDTEWDTIWYLASQEGAKQKLQDFMRLLEEEASRV